MDDDSDLAGGVANAGHVRRQGRYVLRPASVHSAVIHGFLAALRAHGFDGASRPVGIDPDGRERLVFIPGDVAIPPYPAWAQTDRSLASMARLLRRYHDASGHVGAPRGSWSDEMADPQGGPIVCHNDVCLENVVFRDGEAVGLLDLDFAAPGRAVHDLAQFARMCVPVDDDQNASRLGWSPADRAARLRVVADAYGLDATGRASLLDLVDVSIARGGAFVRRRVEAGDPNFIAMWDGMGGEERFDRRRRWFAAERSRFADALA